MADLAHVVWAVNIGCLGLHLWPYLAADPEHADELRIDLDPTTGIGFDEVRAVALRLPRPARRARAARLPQDDRQQRAARLSPARGRAGTRCRSAPAAVALARELERRFPDDSRRTGGRRSAAAASSSTSTRTRPHKTVFGAWFARPRTGGQVSTPLTWDEVESVVPDELTIRTVPDLVRRRGDPWADIAARPQSLEPLLALAERDKEAGPARCAVAAPVPQDARRAAPRGTRAGRRRRRPVDPLDALDQVAFRLERSGADTYKVRAFRHAARAIAATSPRGGWPRWPSRTPPEHRRRRQVHRAGHRRGAPTATCPTT